MNSTENNVPPRNQKSRVRGNLIRIFIALGISIGSSLTTPWRNPRVSPLKEQSVTMSQYQSLTLGDTLTDARAVLGNGIEMSSSKESLIYKWQNCESSHIILEFQGDRLVEKSQLGLTKGCE